MPFIRQLPTSAAHTLCMLPQLSTHYVPYLSHVLSILSQPCTHCIPYLSCVPTMCPSSVQHHGGRKIRFKGQILSTLTGVQLRLREGGAKAEYNRRGCLQE